MTATDWRFADPPNTAVFTTRHVVSQGASILYVTHDAGDGAWQFHAEPFPNVDDAMLVSLRQLVERDPSLIDLADLPMGWCAERSSPGAGWARRELFA